jgi:hypothetical protein
MPNTSTLAPGSVGPRCDLLRGELVEPNRRLAAIIIFAHADS